MSLCFPSDYWHYFIDDFRFNFIILYNSGSSSVELLPPVPDLQYLFKDWLFVGIDDDQLEFYPIRNLFFQVFHLLDSDNNLVFTCIVFLLIDFSLCFQFIDNLSNFPSADNVARSGFINVISNHPRVKLAEWFIFDGYWFSYFFRGRYISYDILFLWLLDTNSIRRLTFSTRSIIDSLGSTFFCLGTRWGTPWEMFKMWPFFLMLLFLMFLITWWIWFFFLLCCSWFYFWYSISYLRRWFW